MTPLPIKRRWLHRTLAVLAVILLALLVKFILHLVLPRNYKGSGEALSIQLPSGRFEVLYYNGDEVPLGIVVLGTGDGGWSYWEERVAKHLVAKHYAVAGWDCRKFADSRHYNQAELGAGFQAAAAVGRKRSGAGDAPLWYGGWSTGAEQSVAAAADSHRPPELVGLLLAAPGEHGRYGITASDLLGMEPYGTGTFALAEFSRKLGGIRVAQFSAGLDPLDNAKWLKTLPKGSYQLIKLPLCLHDMGGAGDEFLRKLDEAMQWSLIAPNP